MVEVDRAIVDKNEDLLNRDSFAAKIAERILDYTNEEPLNIGIIGKWGSGKTSLINLIINNMKSLMDKNDSKTEYIFVNFNPWFFSDQNNLYLQFFKVLNEEIKDYHYGKIPLFERTTRPQESIFRKLRIESLEEYIDYLQLNQTLPIEDFTYSLNFNQIESYESLSFHKNICDDYFESLDCKIVVIIDDMDRLVNEEVNKVITLVRSFADFKNFIYILSFDKNIVAKSLDNVQSDLGDKFLDKIVQIPIILPEINQPKMERIIYKELLDIYNSRLDNYINKEKDLMEILHYLTIFIKDLRDLKRYKNILRFYINNFDDELNIDDCFVLLAVQVFEFRIFSILPDYKSILTSYRQKFMIEGIKIDLTAKFLRYVGNNLINVDSEDMNKVLEYLFPELKGSNFNIDDLTQNNRIGSYYHFDKYFSFSLESNDVSVVLLNKLINCNDENEISEILTKNKNYDYNHFLLRQLYLLNHRIPIENVEIFINSLIKSGERINLYRNDWKFINCILQELFIRINNHYKSFEILKKADSKKNFFTILELVYSVFYKYSIDFSKVEDDIKFSFEQMSQLDDEVIYSFEQIQELENGMIISLKQMYELKELMIVNINEFSKHGKLLNHPRLKTILTYWKELQSEETVKKFLDNNVNSDMEVLDFFTKFQENKLHRSSWGELIDIESNFDFKELRKWKNLEQLIIQVKDISMSENYSDEIKGLSNLIIKKYDEYVDFNKYFQ